MKNQKTTITAQNLNWHFFFFLSDLEDEDEENKVHSVEIDLGLNAFKNSRRSFNFLCVKIYKKILKQFSNLVTMRIKSTRLSKS